MLLFTAIEVALFAGTTERTVGAVVSKPSPPVVKLHI